MAPMTSSGTAVVTLPSDTAIQITREFNAPRDLVFRAWTTPELIARWWAGDRGEVTSVEVDLRPGGRWRYVMRASGGFEVAFRGEYGEVVPGERIVSTEIFEALPDKVATSTVTFIEESGRTTATILVRHQNREDRDMHINSGMEPGMQSSLDHLEQVAAGLH